MPFLDSEQLIEDFIVDDDEEDEALNEFVLQRQASTISTLIQRPQKQLVQQDSIPTTNKLIQAEHIQTGNVKKDVYISYMQAASFLMSSSFVMFYIGYAVLQLGRSIWLSAWSDDGQQNETDRLPESVRINVYGSIGFLECKSFFVNQKFYKF